MKRHPIFLTVLALLIASFASQVHGANACTQTTTKQCDGVGAHNGIGMSTQAQDPTSLSVVDGSSATPSTSSSPVVTISRSSSAAPPAGQNSGDVYINSTRGGDVGAAPALAVYGRQYGPIAGNGLQAIYASVVADVSPTSGTNSHFAGSSAVQQWVPGVDTTSWEFDVDHQYFRAVSTTTGNGVSPIEVTTTVNHQLKVGEEVFITGVTGNTAANGTWTVGSVAAANTFTLSGSTGNGTYAGGGSVFYNSAKDYGTGGDRSQGIVVAAYGTGKHTAAAVIDSVYNGSTGAYPSFYTGIDVRANAITSGGVAFRSKGAVPSVQTANSQYIVWRKADDSGNINVVGVGGANDTIINAAGYTYFHFADYPRAVMVNDGEVALKTSSPNVGVALDANGAIATRRTDATGFVNGNNNDVNIGGAGFVRITSGPTAAFSVTGFTGGLDGRILYVYNATAENMTLADESSSSTAANRSKTNGGTAATVGPGAATLIYDSGASRWILMSLSQ